VIFHGLTSVAFAIKIRPWVFEIVRRIMSKLYRTALNLSLADFTSAFPAGVNVAATWDTDLMNQRGYAMGMEHRGKGVDVQLGPVAGPLGREPEGGRNWEGFSPDPVLTGVAIAQTITGIQDAGVIACAKHFILVSFILSKLKN
jgi:beta-glucosidase-like glycosyl hydrolase